MAVFNRGTYTIYERKEITGDTPLSPQSPTNEIATSKHDVAKTASMVAVSAMVAQSAIGALRNEIGLSTGNEVLQSNINNTMLGAGYLALALKGGLVAVAGIAIKGTVDEMQRQRAIQRQNVATVMENKLRGRRVSIGNNSVYYGG